MSNESQVVDLRDSLRKRKKEAGLLCVLLLPLLSFLLVLDYPN